MPQVLIVDDREESRYMLHTLLTGNGYEVESACQGVEALEKARRNPPQLIISDLLMPMMDGYTLLRHWKADARLKATPFIVYTATFTEPQDEQLALDLGADAFIVKPAEPEQLMARIQEVLTKTEAGGRPPVRLPQGTETVLLQEYGEVVVRKLEEKTAQLETANRALREDVARSQEAEAWANQLLAQAERARAALRENEERLRLALSAANQGFYDVDVSTGQTIVSPEYARMLGYEPEEFHESNDAWRGRLHPDERERVDRVLQEYLAGQRDHYQIEFRQRTKSGDWKWILSSGKVVAWDAEGKPLRVLGTHTDITERKQAAEALQESERKLKETQKMAQLGHWRWDVKSGSVEWSEEVFNIFHLDPNTFSPNIDSIMALSPWPEDQERDKELIRRATESHEKGAYDQRFRRPDGSTGYYHSTFQGNYDGEGNLISIVGTVLDITERKQAEAALGDSEAKYRALVENAGEAIFVAQDGRVKFANPQTEKLTGYSREEILSRSFIEFLHPEEREQALARHTTRMAGGEFPLPAVYRIIHRSGETRWVECSATLIEWEGKRASLNFLSDITEHKRLEQEAKALEAQLRQQQKLESIGTLASGVAHEINNPITGIMNYAQLIQDRLPSESPLTEFTGEIMRETQRVATIVRNLLTFARKEQHGSIPASIGNIVEDTLSLIRTLIRRDQIALTVNVPADLPDLKCRSQQIQQVLMNLMTNARDALNERYPGGDPDKEMRVEAGLIEKQGRRWIRVTVEDHGMGIPPAVRERMFDPFFTTKPRDQGTGLGLSISHGIVKEHHGELTVETESGKFTRMHMDLPVDDGGNP